MQPILIIDDDVSLCELVTEYLALEGYEVEAVHDGESGVARALEGSHALAVLDYMLPGINGFEALRRIRAASAMPVVMLTARADEIDRIVGLEIGADDYLPKPFNPRELLARIRAVLRRAVTTTDGTAEAGGKLVVADVEMESGTRVVHCAGVKIDLTGIEYDLLEKLLQAAGRIVSREELSRDVLQRGLSPFDRSLDMHISNLRKKLWPRTPGGERIKTVRGVGYLYAHASEI